MEAIFPCVAGLDVHKKSVVACVRRLDAGSRVNKQVKTFGTMTRDLLDLGDWLSRHGVTHVAMESTGVYTKGDVPSGAIGFTVMTQVGGTGFLTVGETRPTKLGCA